MAYELQYPDLASALYLALVDDAFYQHLETSVDGSRDRQKQAMASYLDYSIVESEHYGECVFPPDDHYGVSIWSKPLGDSQRAEQSALKKAFIIESMGRAGYDRYDEMVSYMSRQSEALVPKDAWYLSIVGISPEFQGKGLGHGLLAGVLQKTDRLGVATWLETFTVRNMSFYRRLGYHAVASFRLPVQQAEYWLMLRNPR